MNLPLTGVKDGFVHVPLVIYDLCCVFFDVYSMTPGIPCVTVQDSRRMFVKVRVLDQRSSVRMETLDEL